MDWLVQAFSAQLLPSSCPFSWILLHFCLHCCWSTGQGPGLCLRPGGGCWRASVVPFPENRDKHASILSEPAVALSSPCPRFPACLEVLCYIWVNQGMLSDVLATGELLQGQELPRLSLRWNVLPEAALAKWDVQRGLPCESLCRLVDTCVPVLPQPHSSCAFLREEFIQGRFPCPGDLSCIPALGSP